MRKLWNRLVCIFTFVIDIAMISLLLIITTIACVIGVICKRVSIRDYWNAVKNSEGTTGLVTLMRDLWRSFKDGELY